MLRVNWEQFGGSVRAYAVVEARNFNAVEKRLGISHARLINAAQGKPVGTEIFLTLCHWMQVDPMTYCAEKPSPTEPAVNTPAGAGNSPVGEEG